MGSDWEPVDPYIMDEGNRASIDPALKNTEPQSSRWALDYEINQNTGFKYTPQQLGWSSQESQRLSDAGITALPGWFNKKTIYSNAFHLGKHDPISNFIDLYNTPYDEASSKWSASRTSVQSLFGGVDPAAEGEAGKEAYMRMAFGELNNAKDSWWDRNKDWVIGLGGVAGVSAGGLLTELGALGAGAVAGAEAGTAGGGMFGTTVSLTNPAGTGLFKVGGDLATVGSGGLFGTGVGAADLSSLGLAGTAGSTMMYPGGSQTFNEAGTALSEASAAPGQAGAGGANIGSFPGPAATAGGVAAGGSAIDDAIAAGASAGADVGMGAGTNALTSLGMPASYSAEDWLTSLLGGTPGGAGGSAGGVTDWLSKLLGGGASGTDYSWLKPLIGAGSATLGAILGNNAQQDALDKAMKNYAPFRDIGIGAIPAYNASDPTGGAGQYVDSLKNYGTNFKFDATNPEYTFKLDESNRLNNMALSSRGMYNSRAGLNLLEKSNRAITADEFNTQYNRGYQNLMDLYNTSSKLGQTNYNSLLDKIKIGAGSAGQAGSANIASGQVQSQLYTGLGAMPMNYMLLQQLLGGK